MNSLNLDSLSDSQTLLLNQHALSVTPLYHQLIQNLTELNPLNHFLFSSIPSRNPNISPLHLRLSQLSLIQASLPIKFITTSDKPLASLLQSHLPNTNIILKPSQKKPQLNLLKALLYLPQRLLLRKKPSLLSSPITLLENFISNSPQQQSYYPNLLKHLSQEELASTFFLPSFTNFKLFSPAFKIARNAPHQHLIIDDFLQPSDYLHAIKQCYKTYKLSFPPTKFLNFDISPLLSHENKSNAFHPSSIIAHLHHQFTLRLKEHNVKVSSLISWYENQPHNRALIKGFKSNFPSTKITGYQAFFPPASHIHTQPTSLEHSFYLTPHSLAIHSPTLFNQQTQFCPEITPSSAPSLRFQHLFDSNPSPSSPSPKKVLVTLPISIPESNHILASINQIKSKFPKHSFLIKHHPSHKTKNKHTQTPIHNLLQKSHILITSASTTALEAIALNIPTIIFEPLSQISQNPIPPNTPNTLHASAYTSKQLLQSINHFINNPPAPQNNLLNQLFTPTTKQNARNLLNLT